MKEIIITGNESHQRLDRFLMKLLPNASKGFIQKMIRKKNIKHNHKKPDPAVLLQKGDHIQIFFTDETYLKFSQKTNSKFKPSEITLFQDKTFEIIAESEHLLVVNKPANLLTQPDHSGEISLIDLVLDYLITSGSYHPEKELTFTPACSNRLDRNTTGIILIPKDYLSLQTINQLIREKKIQKYYLALVDGIISSPGSCQNFGTKNPKTNLTKLTNTQEKPGSQLMALNYEPLEIHSSTSLLQIELLTGRSHQIRAQLAALGHPILGDPKYGHRALNEKLKSKYGLTSQLLHSYNYIIPSLDFNFSALPSVTFLKIAEALGFHHFKENKNGLLE